MKSRSIGGVADADAAAGVEIVAVPAVALSGTAVAVVGVVALSGAAAAATGAGLVDD
jgi:hypothetical protein